MSSGFEPWKDVSPSFAENWQNHPQQAVSVEQLVQTWRTRFGVDVPDKYRARLGV